MIKATVRKLLWISYSRSANDGRDFTRDSTTSSSESALTSLPRHPRLQLWIDSQSTHPCSSTTRSSWLADLSYPGTWHGIHWAVEKDLVMLEEVLWWYRHQERNTCHLDCATSDVMEIVRFKSKK
jgi:hypothetical protein